MSYSPLDSGFDEVELDKLLPNQLDKQISNLLSRLQTQWVCDRTDNEFEGYLYKRQRKTPHKWILYRFVLSGNNLYYFSDATTKKPRGIIQVSYLSHRLPTTEQHLLEIKNPDVSRTHFMVFSPNRLDILAATSNEDIVKWHGAIDKIVKENMKKEEVAARERALQELLPLMNQKTSQDLERILAIVAELEQSGFSKARTKKEKTGNLDMLVEEEFGETKWVKHYFVLQAQCLYYYKSSKQPPKGVITLKFTQIQVGGMDDAPFSFRLITPLSTFVLQAKHLIALTDWVNALEVSKDGRKKPDTPLLLSSKGGGGLERSGLLSNSNDDYDDLTHIHDMNILDGHSMGYYKKVLPSLSYKTLDGKRKTFKLPLGVTVVGRSDSSNLKLEDKQVSRSHAKIEVNEATAYILDLGSGHGTKVNRVKIDKQLLKPADTIKIGKIRLKFDVVTKK